VAPNRPAGLCGPKLTLRSNFGKDGCVLLHVSVMTRTMMARRRTAALRAGAVAAYDSDGERFDDDTLQAIW
jgi:hypothetical protein